MILPESCPAFQKYGVGSVLRIDPKEVRSRNGRFHRKFFAMLNFLYSYVDEIMPFDVFRAWVTIGAGYFEPLPDGGKIPKSIAFNNMNETDFEDLYKRVIDFCLSEFLPGVMGADDVDAAIETLLLDFA